jgi:hypothetical protein
VAEASFQDVARLNQDWSNSEHAYTFPSWAAFESGWLPALVADYDADRRLNRPAYAWLLHFVCRVWLADWHDTVRRLVDEEGLTAPLLGVRHNYNSVPDLALLPWDALDLCGKNLYTHEDSDAYVSETWDAFRASGVPVLMSEWGVQPTLPPLGYLHQADEVNRAEQAALGRLLASRCPWVVGDVWSNVMDIDFPWGFLDHQGRPKPFVETLRQAAAAKPTSRWSPIAPGSYRLQPGQFEMSGVRIVRTEGTAERRPGVQVR